eukprot:1136541-Pelagomonas_calceolata.AAC.2
MPRTRESHSKLSMVHTGKAGKSRNARLRKMRVCSAPLNTHGMPRQQATAHPRNINTTLPEEK